MYDILFKNVLIADGTGESIYRSNVAVKDGKIEKISNDITGSAELLLEGDDSMILAPGFFDVHSHNDLLVAMDPAVSGGKLDKAAKYGVKTISLSDFLQQISQTEEQTPQEKDNLIQGELF